MAVTIGAFGASLGLVMWLTTQPGIDLADPLVWLAEICFGGPMTEAEMAQMAETGQPLKLMAAFGTVAFAGLGFVGHRKAAVPLAQVVEPVDLDQDATLIICKVARATGGVCAPELLAPIRALCLTPPRLPTIAAALSRANTVPLDQALAPFNRAI
ncbi:MAG: hypothetical protein AAF566_05130, partial [Pseudomonadota bacterium]